MRRNAPEALAGCYAWLLGSIVVRNTFSPLEGSVPELIGERMNKLASKLWMDGEGYLMHYLGEGFSMVRNAEFDELQRWKLDITPERYEKLKKKQSTVKGGSASQATTKSGSGASAKRPKTRRKMHRR